MDRAVQVGPGQSTSATQTSPPAGQSRPTQSSRQRRLRTLSSQNNPKAMDEFPTISDYLSQEPKVWLTGEEKLGLEDPSFSGYWGMYSDKKHPLAQLQSRPTWVAPSSDISKYGWYLNHFVFAFFMAMCCTDCKF